MGGLCTSGKKPPRPPGAAPVKHSKEAFAIAANEKQTKEKKKNRKARKRRKRKTRVAPKAAGKQSNGQPMSSNSAGSLEPEALRRRESSTEGTSFYTSRTSRNETTPRHGSSERDHSTPELARLTVTREPVPQSDKGRLIVAAQEAESVGWCALVDARALSGLLATQLVPRKKEEEQAEQSAVKQAPAQWDVEPVPEHRKLTDENIDDIVLSALLEQVRDLSCGESRRISLSVR